MIKTAQDMIRALKRGTSTPCKARKSRGNVIRVWTSGGNEWRVSYDGHYRLQTIERT